MNPTDVKPAESRMLSAVAHALEAAEIAAHAPPEVFYLEPSELFPHPLLGREGMLSDLILREDAMGNKDGEKRQSHKDKAEKFREEQAAILESIRDAGIKDPLKVCQNVRGQWLILDGRHRAELATELGLPSVPCQEYPETEARALIMAAAVRRQVSKGTRAYQAVTFYPEVALEGSKRAKAGIPSAVTAVGLGTRTGVSPRLMEYAIWLYKKFQEREDIREFFEPSIYAGNSLDKVKGAVEARLKGLPDIPEDELVPDCPKHRLFLSCQVNLYRLQGTWETWDNLKPEDQGSAKTLVIANLKTAPAVVRQAILGALTAQEEEEA